MPGRIRWKKLEAAEAQAAGATDVAEAGTAKHAMNVNGASGGSGDDGINSQGPAVTRPLSTAGLHSVLYYARQPAHANTYVHTAASYQPYSLLIDGRAAGGPKYSTPILHRALVTGLEAGKTYWFAIADSVEDVSQQSALQRAVSLQNLGPSPFTGLFTVPDEDDYDTLLGLNFLFWEGQMSGPLPYWNRLLYNKPGGYKKSSHLNDGATLGLDLSGGFYDAGDYLKCALPLAWSVANLALSMLEFGDAYEAAGQKEAALRTIRWATDWLLKGHYRVSEVPSENAFVGQVGGVSDHSFFGRPEHASTARFVFVAHANRPGADLAAMYAAAFAAAAAVFVANRNQDYAATLFKHSQQAMGFAENSKGNWQLPGKEPMAYKQPDLHAYQACCAFAKALMCKYSAADCKVAAAWFNWTISHSQPSLGYGWHSTLTGAAAVHVSLNTSVAPQAKVLLDQALAVWQNTTSTCTSDNTPGSRLCYTPRGLAHGADWGPLAKTANSMFLATLVAKHDSGSRAQQHICWARSQMRYFTGAAGVGRSFIIGYDVTGAGGCCDFRNFVLQIPAQIQLSGALVSGPLRNDTFPDKRTDFQTGEVALDYNAALTGVVAGLSYFAARFDLSSCNDGSDFGCTVLGSPHFQPVVKGACHDCCRWSPEANFW
eukprot:gene8741-8921_t